MAVVIRVVRPAALIRADHARHHAVAMDHASHLNQFVDGFIDPGQLTPHVMAPSANEVADERSAR